MPVNQTQFTVLYEGQALRDSSMDVQQLAPALLAFGKVLDRANHILNGDKAFVSVQVKAFKAGCFGINFELVQTYAQAVKNLFNPGGAVRETLEILGLLGLTPKDIVACALVGGFSLYKLIRFSRGKKPEKKQVLQDGSIKLTFKFEKEETVSISKDVAQLYKDIDLRNEIYKSLEPLEDQGIDSFSVERDGQREELATSSDLYCFVPPDMGEQEIPVDETPREAVLSIVSLSFKEDNKWRLSDGDLTFNVQITDKNFLRSIDQGASFSKGDLLRVLLVTKVYYTRTGLKTEYEAVKVLEHRKSPIQLSLL